MTSGAVGLYLHIPFCTRMCHYCDFAKTAHHEASQRKDYLARLEQSVQSWLAYLCSAYHTKQPLRTLYLGGGTPSLFTEEYQALAECLRPCLWPEAEFTLEANPEHINEANLRTWRALGVNRISLGVQSFQQEGLRFLTREHSPEEAGNAVRQAKDWALQVNIDLIYGWPGQTLVDWEKELDRTLALGPHHLSLYALTYEGKTPMVRRLERGRIQPTADSQLASCYERACERLRGDGWVHEEVSNWARPGCEAAHNATYWQGESYLGIGSGAHSYLADQGPFGLRWFQNDKWRNFKPKKEEMVLPSLDSLLKTGDYHIEAERDAEAWIFETVSSGLRTQWGVNLDEICRRSGYNWCPRPAILQGLASGCLAQSGQSLYLAELEWFRETSWSLELAMSFQMS